MNEIIKMSVERLIGLTVVTSLTEATLPKDGLFPTVRAAAGICYLSELILLFTVILSELGG
ncbi:MAG: hypothetical protein IJK01_00530 [Clostridia bacterium]|nr:hypothetical protein [Clostridia bacterium]